MHNKQEIKQLVQKNIHQIKVSEFVTEGGWPNIDNVDVAIYSQKEIDNEEIIHLQILYTVDKAGCCFIPGGEEQKRLSKTVTINKNSVTIV
ncbi:hypothetical protein [Wenyingzhuangia marina]|uniref:Uncharacterized protein n=1 Tax=Wenyingzhuangia marina TaxID=1195760 RepID=A0A1M5V2Q9_9FLAO|nr:hypothetical protein [Wenyingzhuangia marina]GGF74973.1 hypothetical protein GCM10011397_17380 [Wenyingzhuangia marina]SHH69243.1 hypothetical protein SAMN05444281_1438 [Wenyingzhuangia marina]